MGRHFAIAAGDKMSVAEVASHQAPPQVRCFNFPLCEALFPTTGHRDGHVENCSNEIVRCDFCRAVMRQFRMCSHDCPGGPGYLTTTSLRGSSYYSDLLVVFKSLPWQTLMVPPDWIGDRMAEHVTTLVTDHDSQGLHEMHLPDGAVPALEEEAEIPRSGWRAGRAERKRRQP